MTLTVDLDRYGRLLGPAGEPIRNPSVKSWVERNVRIPPSEITDIVLFVHGWKTSPASASKTARSLADGIARRHVEFPALYPELAQFSPLMVNVRWPSQSAVWNFGRIRDRTAYLAREGQAADVVARILSSIDNRRSPPRYKLIPDLATDTGQFLHCIGHSFGCRVLTEAIIMASNRGVPDLGWSHDSRFKYGVDTTTLLQMAAPASVFSGRFSRLLHASPVHGPVVATFSAWDYALNVWHRIRERTPAVGAVGARGLGNDAVALRLKAVNTPYTKEDFAARLVNVDSSWKMRRGRAFPGSGAHSDYLIDEVFHLLLSLVSLTRRTKRLVQSPPSNP